MSASPVVNYKDFNINNIKINPRAKQSQGNPSKRVYVNYGRGQFFISTPKMKMPFGLSEYDPAKFGSTGEVKLHFEPTFEGNDDFKKCIVELENLIWESIIANQEQWLGLRGKKMIPTTDNDHLRSNYLTPIVRENVSKDGTEYPETIRFKVVKDYNAATAGNTKYDIYAVDRKNREIDFREVPKMCDARFVIKFTGLVIINGKVHPAWKCCQIKVYNEGQPKLPKLAFIDDSDSDNSSSDDPADCDDDTSLVEAVVPTESSEAPSRDMAQMQSALDSLEDKKDASDDDSSEDDEEESDDDTEEDAPAPASVAEPKEPKKRGRPSAPLKKQ